MSELETPGTDARPLIGEPPPVASQFVKWGVALSVTVGVGFSPFLGNYKVPFFSSLLDMYPESMRGWLIPLSSLLMGILAVCVEFAAASKDVPQKRLETWFWRTVGAFFIFFVLLIGVYLFTVARIDKAINHDEVHTLSFVTGTLTVPHHPPWSKCGCQEGMDADTCLEGASVRPSHIKACFGAARVASATFVLALLYFLLTGTFAASVALLILRKRAKDATAGSSRSGRSATPRP
jgi:hypothetical protein